MADFQVTYYERYTMVYKRLPNGAFTELVMQVQNDPDMVVWNAVVEGFDREGHTLHYPEDKDTKKVSR